MMYASALQTPVLLMMDSVMARTADQKWTYRALNIICHNTIAVRGRHMVHTSTNCRTKPPGTRGTTLRREQTTARAVWGREESEHVSAAISMHT